jgi:hypothetical protein
VFRLLVGMKFSNNTARLVFNADMQQFLDHLVDITMVSAARGLGL